MKSIIQSSHECLICGDTNNLECHHIFYGTANRKWSEKFGLTCFLCHYHHTGNGGIHFDKSMDKKLKKYAQEKFEEVYGGNETFMKIFGRNYK